MARSCRAAFKTCGFHNAWMAKAFQRMDSQCFQNMRRPMLCILAAHIIRAASVRPSPNGAGGREFIMCSTSIKSIGLCIFLKYWPPILSKALAIHILQKPPATHCFKSFPVQKNTNMKLAQPTEVVLLLLADRCVFLGTRKLCSC